MNCETTKRPTNKRRERNKKRQRCETHKKMKKFPFELPINIMKVNMQQPRTRKRLHKM